MSFNEDWDQIWRDRELLEWAKEQPQQRDTEDGKYPLTEEEKARHDHAVREWGNKRPRDNSRRGDDR